jgi:hypothetical protein
MLTDEDLFLRYRGKAVLLDSNLLLVFLCGALGSSVFKRFKRISAYTPRDYELLAQLLAQFSVLATTPHILTEVGNLANSLPSWHKPDWYRNLAALFEPDGNRIRVLERWIPAVELMHASEFVSFGITDAAVASLCGEMLLVTEDCRLSSVLQSRGLPAINFNHIKQLQGRF